MRLTKQLFNPLVFLCLGVQASAGDSDAMIELHDFAEDRAGNLLGGEYNVFTSPKDPACLMTRAPLGPDDGSGEPNMALYLNYDVTAEGAYGGFWSSLEGVSLDGYDQLAMKVKTSLGQQSFRVGLRNKDRREVRVHAAEYLREADANGWQDLTIPLLAFRDIESFAEMDVLSVSFTYDDRSGKGILLVDDVRFLKGFDRQFLTDFDGANPALNWLGLPHFYDAVGPAAISTDYEPAASGDGQCLRLSYGGNIGAQSSGGESARAIWGTLTGGLNVSRATALQFRIRGQQGGEKLNVYVGDGSNKHAVDLEAHRPLTTDWTLATIPLQAFASQGIDLGHVDEVSFVMEGEAMSSTVYLDDLEFTSDD